MARPDPRNTSRYWRACDLPGIDMLQADFTTHDYAPHVHDALVIAVTEIGGSEFKSRGRTDVAHPQALLVFNPAEPHSGRMGGSERWLYRSFYLAQPAIEDILSAVGTDQPGYFTSNVVRDQDLVTRFTALHHVLEREPGMHFSIAKVPFASSATCCKGTGSLRGAFPRHREMRLQSLLRSNSCATATRTT